MNSSPTGLRGKGRFGEGSWSRLPGGAGNPSPGTRQELWSHSLVTNNQNMKKHLFSSSPTWSCHWGYFGNTVFNSFKSNIIIKHWLKQWAPIAFVKLGRFTTCTVSLYALAFLSQPLFFSGSMAGVEAGWKSQDTSRSPRTPWTWLQPLEMEKEMERGGKIQPHHCEL